MFAWLGKIMGTDKAMASAIKVVSNGLDSLIHTDQEKAEERAKDKTEVRQMLVGWMESTQGQNLARRLIALAIVFGWLGLYLFAALFSFIAIWFETPDRFMQSAELVGNFATGLNGAVMLILSFYFAAPHMGKVVETALAAFGKVPTGPKPELKHEG